VCRGELAAAGEGASPASPRAHTRLPQWRRRSSRAPRGRSCPACPPRCGGCRNSGSRRSAPRTSGTEAGSIGPMSAPPASPFSRRRPKASSAVIQGASIATPPSPARSRTAVGRAAPPSASSAATCFASSAWWAAAYPFPPARPFSSFMKSTTRNVRRGGRGSDAIRRPASIHHRHPAPSSLAPVARVPGIEVRADQDHFFRTIPAAHVRDHVRRVRVRSIRQPSDRRTRTGPRWSRRCRRSASSVLTAAAGMRPASAS